MESEEEARKALAEARAVINDFLKLVHEADTDPFCIPMEVAFDGALLTRWFVVYGQLANARGPA